MLRTGDVVSPIDTSIHLQGGGGGGHWGSGFGARGVGFRVWGLGFGVWGLGFGVWGCVFSVGDVGWGVLGWTFRLKGFGVWGFGFLGLGCGVWGPGCRDVNLRFRMQGSGCSEAGLAWWSGFRVCAPAYGTGSSFRFTC